MNVDAMITQWESDLQGRMQDQQTVRDYMRALEFYRQDVRRAGLDLDDSAAMRLTEIAVGWKHIALTGKPITWATAHANLAGPREFYKFAEQQGWISCNPSPR
jgi:site-specific recombinase XerD